MSLFTSLRFDGHCRLTRSERQDLFFLFWKLYYFSRAKALRYYLYLGTLAKVLFSLTAAISCYQLQLLTYPDDGRDNIEGQDD